MGHVHAGPDGTQSRCLELREYEVCLPFASNGFPRSGTGQAIGAGHELGLGLRTGGGRGGHVCLGGWVKGWMSGQSCPGPPKAMPEHPGALSNGLARAVLLPFRFAV